MVHGGVLFPCVPAGRYRLEAAWADRHLSLVFDPLSVLELTGASPNEVFLIKKNQKELKIIIFFI
jgi:hypothetical protein